MRSLPDGPARDRQETELQLALGLCSYTAKGAVAGPYTSQRACRYPGQFAPALRNAYRVWQCNAVSGGIFAARPLSERLLWLTHGEQDTGLRLQAHHSAALDFNRPVRLRGVVRGLCNRAIMPRAPVFKSPRNVTQLSIGVGTLGMSRHLFLVFRLSEAPVEHWDRRRIAWRDREPRRADTPLISDRARRRARAAAPARRHSHISRAQPVRSSVCDVLAREHGRQNKGRSRGRSVGISLLASSDSYYNLLNRHTRAAFAVSRTVALQYSCRRRRCRCRFARVPHCRWRCGPVRRRPRCYAPSPRCYWCRHRRSRTIGAGA